MKYILLLLILALTLTGCTKVSQTPKTEEETDIITESETADTVLSSDMFTDRDLDTSYTDAVTIELDGKDARASSDTVRITDNTVTITEEADYLISGSYEGTLKVEAGDKAKPHLIFDSVEIVSDNYAALYITEADKVVVTLKGESILKNDGSFDSKDENNVDGAVFSKQDLSFNGDGMLKVESASGHGIVCKDDFVLTGGSYTVYSASHGIDANDSVRIRDITLDIDSGKDGVHCENTEDTNLGFVYIESGSFSLESEGDGVSASSYIQIKDGDLKITAGGGAVNGSNKSSGGWGGFMGGYYGGNSTEDSESIKGIKAEGNIILDGGSFGIDSADDAIHSNTAITVNGGSYEIKSGDDGFHADDTLIINKANISITQSYEGLEAYEVTLNDGDISIYATDDGINAAGGNDQSGYGGRDNGMFGGPGGMGGMDNGGIITVSGSKLYINASGDGLDSNGELYVKGGEVVVSGPTVGDTATLDYATEGIISGGSFVGTGGLGMNACFDSSSPQGVIMVAASGMADTSIVLADSDGNILMEHTADQSFNCIILSHPDIKAGQSYTLKVGTESMEITMTSTVYSSTGGPGGGMPGTRPGGGPGYGSPGRPGGKW